MPRERIPHRYTFFGLLHRRKPYIVSRSDKWHVYRIALWPIAQSRRTIFLRALLVAPVVFPLFRDWVDHCRYGEPMKLFSQRR